MSKKAIGLVIALILLIGVGFYFFGPSDKPKKEEKTTTDSSSDVEYQILYNRAQNQIYEQNDCKYLTLTDYLGAGLADMKGTINEIYESRGYPLSYPRAKVNDNFYYTSADDDPTKKFQGVTIINWGYEDQKLYSQNFESKQIDEVLSSSDLTFPSDLEVSPDNKYLVYLMTEKNEDEHSIKMNQPFVTDSKLIVRDLDSGQEEVVFGGYSRQLFDSLADFSSDGSSFYTIRQSGLNYEIVKIDLAAGEATAVEEIVEGYDGSDIDWDKLFPGGEDYNNGYFHLSPKENQIIAYKNTPATDVRACASNYTYTIWTISLESGQMEEVLTGNQSIIKGAWSPSGDSFAFAAADRGGCYPGYMKSSIYGLAPETGEKTVYLSQKEGKINTLAYHPKGEKIVYGIYGTNYISYLKSLDINSKEVSEIISSEDTEGEIDKDNPVVLFFSDWVEVK